MLKMLLLSVLLGALVQKSSAQDCKCSPLVNLINTINVPAKDIKILSITIPQIGGILPIGELQPTGAFQLTANPDDLVIKNGQLTLQLAAKGFLSIGDARVDGVVDLELKATLTEDCKLSGIDVKAKGSGSLTLTIKGVKQDIINVGETTLPVKVAKALAIAVGKVIDGLLQNQDGCVPVDG